MCSEKSQIISLLEQGKINVDEAERLLRALGPNWSAHTVDRQKVQEHFENFTGKAGDVAKTVRDRLSETWDTVEPKVKSGMRIALEKTIEVVDKLSVSLKESLDNMEAGACSCGCEDEEESECCADDASNGEPPVEPPSPEEPFEAAPAPEAPADDVPIEN